MKVKDLIKQLQKIDNKNANVYIYDVGCGQYLNIENVDDTMVDQVDLNVSSEETKDQDFINEYTKIKQLENQRG